jgi:hypothetical protein
MTLGDADASLNGEENEVFLSILPDKYLLPGHGRINSLSVILQRAMLICQGMIHTFFQKYRKKAKCEGIFKSIFSFYP